MSRYHLKNPYEFKAGVKSFLAGYEPGEAKVKIMGGNSNWRGPVWFPINYLLVESLEKYHAYHGGELLVECPSGSGRRVTLQGAAAELRRRLISTFEYGE